ncbi:MAG: TetR/AcrR family transcriptional regulator [Bacteroidetes bacterium]|nr:TetR/AcrR family transcriptional regulator [Bacteroidota bacterium]
MDELITKISKLFKKHGIKSVTMDDIAREFSISKKTLYQNFKNKNEVIEKIAQLEFKCELEDLENICHSHANAIEQLLALSKYLANKLNNFNPSLTYDLTKYYPLIWKKFNKKRKKQISSLINQNIQTGIEQDFYHKNIKSDIITDFYMFKFDINGFESYNGLKENFDEIFNTLFVCHVRGISNNKGIKYIEKLFIV